MQIRIGVTNLNFMKKTYWFLLFGLLFNYSCQQVSDLSDDAAVESATVSTTDERVIIDGSAVKIENNSVVIPLEFGRKHFPLTLSADLKFSSTTVGTLPTDKAHTIDFKNIVFNDVYEQPSFYLIAESGVPHLWNIRFKDKLDAEIEKFTVKNIPPEKIKTILIEQNNIHIVLARKVDTWPFAITPEIEKTATATYKGNDYQEGQDLNFLSFDDVKTITLVSDNQDERVWNIYLESSTPLIKNSNFDLWINTEPKDGGINPKINIDPMPGRGLGWATANNTYVVGTLPIERNGGFAAQMTTSIQNLDFIGLGQLLAAGTTYTGYFNLSLQLDNPRSMTYFGIPFAGRPDAVEIEAQYIPGQKLQQSVKQGGQYVLTDLPGRRDKGHIWVKLLHWKGEGDFVYHNDEVLPSGLQLVGEGEYVFDEQVDATDWKRIKIDINYKNLQTQPTHIAIVMTSSKEGDYFVGAVGSTLRVDNLSLIYE